MTEIADYPWRWYCVSNDGQGMLRGTLCLDEADARNMAAQRTRDYPQFAPYRAVLMGDVAAERERCAKLCEALIDSRCSIVRAEHYQECADAIRALNRETK